MRDSFLWVPALQVRESQFEEWKALAPKQESFTYWCLKTGRLAAHAYFDWAREHYGIAKVESGYFKHRPSFDLWSQIQTVANWSPWMLPLEQWDGVIFIGCVEPPTEMP